jgi:ABC-type phosphate transport system substrate-binding protein
MLVAGLLASLAAASASAGVLKACEGADITGQGASVANIAFAGVWGPKFNVSSNPYACNGTQGGKQKPTVAYDSTSSAAGQASWGALGGSGYFGASNAYIATDEPPNAIEKSEIERYDEPRGTPALTEPESLYTIPVTGESIAVLVHLPPDCEANSKAAPGRLALNNSTLEKIFAGQITSWNEITEDGDTVSGGPECQSTTHIVPIVRHERAGSTDIFKRYLGLVDTGSFPAEAYPTMVDGEITCSAALPAGQPETWDSVSEGCQSQRWPEPANVTRAGAAGDNGEVAAIASTASSIGYAGLADARQNPAFGYHAGTGEPHRSTFWVELQHGGSIKRPKYADPSVNGESATVSNANCSKTVFTDGTHAFPPSMRETWNGVTTSVKEKNYTLCGLIYALYVQRWCFYESAGRTEATADTAWGFIEFIRETKDDGGQILIANHDYTPKILSPGPRIPPPSLACPPPPT